MNDEIGLEGEVAVTEEAQATAEIDVAEPPQAPPPAAEPQAPPPAALPHPAPPPPVASFEPTWVYAVGRIEARFPSLSVEKEFAQVSGQHDTAGYTDRETLRRVLMETDHRYLARQMCWVLTVEGVDTYILQPRDSRDYRLLIEALRPAPRKTDVDVVIGQLGPIAPPEMCNALMVPIVVFDQIYSFDVDGLMESIPKPKGLNAAQFKNAAEEVFGRITQMHDNAGATDADRALNYLSVRYPDIYHEAAGRFAIEQSLTNVEVRSSRLGGTRSAVDVVFAYTDRRNDVEEKMFVRVDVTEQFPFLVKKLAPYFERG